MGALSLRYRIAGNFRGRKLLRISRFESHPRKFSPRNLGGAAPIYDWFQAIRESFLCEILTSYGFAKVFSLESLLLYSMFCSLLLRQENKSIFIPNQLFGGGGVGVWGVGVEVVMVVVRF